MENISLDRIVKNYEALVTSDLKKDAIEILESGYRAILTPNVIKNTISRNGTKCRIGDLTIDLADYECVLFVGVGKCAADAGADIEEIFGEDLTAGIVLDVKSGSFKKIKSLVGTHPYPSAQNVEAAKEIQKMLSGLSEKDLVIAVVSGGGSSLLSLPHNLPPETLSLVTKMLMHKGAPISELNIVRKHLSEIQGGFLAQTAYPAHVVSLIFSDVPGNDPGTISSGPTVKDTSTKTDAEEILKKYGVLDNTGHLDLLETPKDDKYFLNVHNMVVVTNDTALGAMVERAKELGYEATIESSRIQGEARDLGKKMAEEPHGSKKCYLYGGETTVTVTGHGVGGRNQELVLGALPYLSERAVIVAAGSDGYDNSACAGAIGDKELYLHAKELGLDPVLFLAENNSFEFFEKAGGHIITGLTGANVADLYFVLCG